MKNQWLFPAIFGGIGIILLAITGFLCINEKNFVAHAKITDGRVVRLDYHSGKNGGGYHPVVEYSYNGTTAIFRSSVGTNPPEFNVGEQVQVYFNPDNPSDAQIKDFWSQWLMEVILGGIGFLFAAIGGGIGFAVVRKKKNMEFLLANGKKIDATFQSVQLNTSYKVNGRSPYKIYSQWLDQSSNTVYQYSSDNIWFDPTSYISNGKVPVFIDPANPKKYYVDISFLPQQA